jgi:hypothetical protein
VRRRESSLRRRGRLAPRKRLERRPLQRPSAEKKNRPSAPSGPARSAPQPPGIGEPDAIQELRPHGTSPTRAAAQRGMHRSVLLRAPSPPPRGHRVCQAMSRTVVTPGSRRTRNATQDVVPACVVPGEVEPALPAPPPASGETASVPATATAAFTELTGRLAFLGSTPQDSRFRGFIGDSSPSAFAWELQDKEMGRLRL